MSDSPFGDIPLGTWSSLYNPLSRPPYTGDSTSGNVLISDGYIYPSPSHVPSLTETYNPLEYNLYSLPAIPIAVPVTAWHPVDELHLDEGYVCTAKLGTTGYADKAPAFSFAALDTTAEYPRTWRFTILPMVNYGGGVANVSAPPYALAYRFNGGAWESCAVGQTIDVEVYKGTQIFDLRLTDADGRWHNRYAAFTVLNQAPNPVIHYWPEGNPLDKDKFTYSLEDAASFSFDSGESSDADGEITERKWEFYVSDFETFEDDETPGILLGAVEENNPTFDFSQIEELAPTLWHDGDNVYMPVRARLKVKDDGGPISTPYGNVEDETDTIAGRWSEVTKTFLIRLAGFVQIGSFLSPAGVLHTARNDGQDVQLHRFKGGVATRENLAKLAGHKNPTILQAPDGTIYLLAQERSGGAWKLRKSADGGRTLQ